jgi:hypothetical protein
LCAVGILRRETLETGRAFDITVMHLSPIPFGGRVSRDMEEFVQTTSGLKKRLITTNELILLKRIWTKVVVAFKMFPSI